MKIIIVEYSWYINLLNCFPFTQNNVEEKEIFVPVALFISWTIAVCWLTNTQPHFCVKHQYDISLSLTPPQISELFFFFSSIFLNEKIYFSSYPLIDYTDPQWRNYLLGHFLPIMSNPIQQSSLLSLLSSLVSFC